MVHPVPLMNSKSMRSRKVDPKKPLPVFRASELQDLDVASLAAANVAAVATGVEKEEEEEHHLQAALSAHSSSSGVAAPVVIPTPDASKLAPDFERYYSRDYKQPPTLIRYSALTEESAECPYNIDEADFEWLTRHNESLAASDPKSHRVTEDEFEHIVWTLEKTASEKLMIVAPSLSEAESALSSSIPALHSLCRSSIPSIFEHWSQRRFIDRHGKPIQPQLRLEEIGLTVDMDPYVCFRRREIKPMRKTRAGDTKSLEKLKKLRDEMQRSREILELVAKRERMRKESLVLEHLIFQQRVLVRTLRKKLGVGLEERAEVASTPEQIHRLKKMRKLEGLEDTRTPTKIKIPFPKLKDLTSLADAPERAAEIAHRSPTSVSAHTVFVKQKKAMEEKAGWVDLTEQYHPPAHPLLSDGYRFLDENDEPNKHRTHRTQERLMGRRRIGRGGRVHFDRVRCRPYERKQWDLDENQPVPDIENNLDEGDKSSDPDADLEASAKVRYPALGTYNRFRFDSDEGSADEDMDLLEDSRILAYRATMLSESDYRLLQCKPTFPEQINPQPALGPRSQLGHHAPASLAPANSPNTSTAQIASEGDKPGTAAGAPVSTSAGAAGAGSESGTALAPGQAAASKDPATASATAATVSPSATPKASRPPKSAGTAPGDAPPAKTASVRKPKSTETTSAQNAMLKAMINQAKLSAQKNASSAASVAASTPDAEPNLGTAVSTSASESSPGRPKTLLGPTNVASVIKARASKASVSSAVAAAAAAAAASTPPVRMSAVKQEAIGDAMPSNTAASVSAASATSTQANGTSTATNMGTPNGTPSHPASGGAPGTSGAQTSVSSLAHGIAAFASSVPAKAQMSSPKPSPTPSMRAPMATAAHSITSSGQEAGPIAFALQALSNSAHTSNFSGSTLGNGQYATQTSSLPTAQAQALQLQLKQLQLQFQLQNQLQANGSALNPSILQLQSSVAPQAHPSLQNTTSSLFAQFKTQAQAHAHAQAQVHGQTQAQVQAQALQLVGEEAAVGTPSPAVVQATQLQRYLDNDDDDDGGGHYPAGRSWGR
ncbi:enhancer of polycomb-like-domain-containing protein [Polychytrium aggregatum]|uniref:enhancer of polycomb-like-domain-containing protein n=1 Tax=Polychytrium aggregatum TaxID=110093 RepID=UPI0022FDE3E3|nr:enhancer of polycomb-like-domain-containing protein [Polychytrium aggregatum]KAI9202210.1 enhancer of polycomb-like-domain-containing protein [Polychytrium aggregatum]